MGKSTEDQPTSRQVLRLLLEGDIQATGFTQTQFAHINEIRRTYATFNSLFPTELNVKPAFFIPLILESDLLYTRVHPNGVEATREQRGIVTTDMRILPGSQVMLPNVIEALGDADRDKYAAAKICARFARYLRPNVPPPRVRDFINNPAESAQVLDAIYRSKESVEMPQPIRGILTESRETVTSLGGDTNYQGNDYTWSRYVEYTCMGIDEGDNRLILLDMHFTWQAYCRGQVSAEIAKRQAVIEQQTQRGAIYARPDLPIGGYGNANK